MIFYSDLLIRFAHCDPAGIVFYPRYYEMMNGVVEDWCAHGLGMSFHELHIVRKQGFPAVRIETDFVKASEIGETLRASLHVTRIGGASLDLAVRFTGPNDDLRLSAKIVLVLMDLEKRRAMAIPDEMRAKIQKFCPA